MAIDNSAQAQLIRLSNYKHGNASVMATALVEFIQTGDIKHVDSLPTDTSIHSLDQFASAVVAEDESTEVSKAIWHAAVHRIATRNPFEQDALSVVFTRQLTGYFKNEAIRFEEIRPDVKLLERLREKGLSDLRIMQFWVANPCAQVGSLYARKTASWIIDTITHPGEHYSLPLPIEPRNAFEQLFLDLSDEDMLTLLKSHEQAEMAPDKTTKRWGIQPAHGVVAHTRPDIMSTFIEQLDIEVADSHAISWCYVCAATDEFDQQCLNYTEHYNDIYPVLILDALREGKYRDIAVKRCMAYESQGLNRVLSYLAAYDQDSLIEKLYTSFLTDAMTDVLAGSGRDIFFKAAEHWDNGGEKIFTQLSAQALSAPGNEDKYHALLRAAIPVAPENEGVRSWLEENLPAFNGLKGHANQTILNSVAYHAPDVMESTFWEYLQSKLKSVREFGVKGLKHERISNAIDNAAVLLNEGKVDARLGAIELLMAIDSEDAKKKLVSALENKNSAKVHQKLLASIEELGIVLADEELSEDQLGELLGSIEKKKIARLTKAASWVDLSALPPLKLINGDEMSEKVLTQLIAIQSKHKTINPSPDNRVLYSSIDKDSSGEFALALLKQWKSSSQDAQGKWALALTGILGDRRVLTELSDPIHAWAENARHKLAEYAAQAIALVPSQESLMLLDMLANRYRRRFKNIGRACTEALSEAAKNQNVSIEELGDMIVPDFEFDEEYQRELPGTPIKAVLQPDFKFTFYNPETESETKSAPKSLPDEALADIKTIKALIRQTVKAQTVRLESALTGQRSWTTKRWQELYETNPFLQSFASRLVWSTLDGQGKLVKLFRRYPNGLLADASGELIEFDDGDHSIVMVHPLNLTDEQNAQWMSHLKRMKVKAPFPQLERPVAKLDPNHANRKSLNQVDKHKMASGTFRSRSEKLGWMRSSVSDGGGINAYYKTYVSAQVSVFLSVEDTYIGQDPADELKLGVAMFVRADSVQVGSYTYDEPRDADDPRVLAFGDIPAVVYSETVTDLAAITA